MDFATLCGSELPELDDVPHSQLLEYGDNLRRFKLHFRPRVREYLEVAAVPTVEDLRKYIFESQIHKWWLMELITETRENIIMVALQRAATSYDVANGTNYAVRLSSLSVVGSGTSGGVETSIYRGLRERVLRETTAGRLIASGLYLDAHRLVLGGETTTDRSATPESGTQLSTADRSATTESATPESGETASGTPPSTANWSEFYPLILTIPPADYGPVVSQLLLYVGENTEDGRVVAASHRDEIEYWLLERLVRQFQVRPPTTEERRNYWTTGDNLTALSTKASEFFTVMEDAALSELYDYIVRHYERNNHYYGDGYESQDPDLSLMHEAGPRLLSVLRSETAIAELLQRGDYRAVRAMANLGSETPGYQAVTAIVREIYPISRDEIVEHACDTFVESLGDHHHESRVADVLNNFTTSHAVMVFLQGLQDRLAGMVDSGEITSDDETLDSSIARLLESGGIQEMEDDLIEGIERELLGRVVDLCVSHYYSEMYSLLAMQFEHLSNASPGTEESETYQQLLERLSPVVRDTSVGSLLEDDLYTEMWEEMDGDEPSEKLRKSLRQIIGSPVTELALLDTFGSNLGNHLESSGVLDSPVRQGSEERHALVVDLEFLLSLKDSMSSSSAKVWLPESEVLFYRSSTLATLRRAIELSIDVVLYNAPLVGYRDLFRRLRELLPGVLICRIPPIADADGSYSAKLSLSSLLASSVRPTSSSIIVKGGEWPAATRGVTNANIAKISRTTNILWFTRRELFPAEDLRPQLRMRPSTVNIILLVGNSIAEVDNAFISSLKQRPVPQVYHISLGNIPRNLDVGSVTVCLLHNHDHSVGVNFVVLAGQVRSLRTYYRESRGLNLSVRVVWYHVDSGDYQSDDSRSNRLWVKYVGDIQDFLSTLDGPPVRFEN